MVEMMVVKMVDMRVASLAVIKAESWGMMRVD